ncbi:formylglycine-generating enzyme family protein [Agrobacterium sp. rho-8.1]|nr:formylglycine-generating enzyme family protein [Agrobacterium sp. rho-8.1]
MKTLTLIPLIAGVISMPQAVEADEVVRFAKFGIDRNEITIARFEAFIQAHGVRSVAEREGGGHEWGVGWERRPGWNYLAPFGEVVENKALPAVHVSWREANEYCIWVGGRLPTRNEWSEAAYKEQRENAPPDMIRGEIYPYPTGSDGRGANTSNPDPWPQLSPIATTKAGVNGLFDMGGNAWEWLADRHGDSALTAGGSWWYDREKMTALSMQWKPAEFYAVYVGFRCAYDHP